MDKTDSALDIVVVPRTRDLGDHFEVRRALPTTQRRMVGPFVFFDQMGPHVFAAGAGLDVRPHPHIGLATVTYLFDGEILHRDSLNTVQPIRPGEVNWMTAGRGIVHSERTAPDIRRQSSSLFGLQCWVALPRQHEETDPSFQHFKATQLPREEGEGIVATVIAGRFFGRQAPVPVLSELFYVDVQLESGATLTIPPDYDEQALYIVEGRVDMGKDGLFDAGQLLVLKPGKTATVTASGAPARLMLLGGEPMDGPRAVVWNFVSSSAERLEQAKEDWRMQRFPRIQGESEWIPFPEQPGKPVFYP
ncbi:pirin family protein [Oxalobacteraceae bacterium R-40]|uniref:Pirin family protein n=1 Tax=Keguizhuia sedimenti TaxID=3064264 RepID=A0ABU1BM10_9BURK|nr:pirin family protein [Oxalobacteraceae bacterium R-40]